MGSHSTLSVFSIDRLFGLVVPALRAGEHHPLIRATIAAHPELFYDGGPGPDGQWINWSCGFEGLAQVMTHVDATFTRCDLGESFHIAADGSRLPDADGPVPGAWDHPALVTLVQTLIVEQVLTADLVHFGRASLWRALRLDRPGDHPDRLRQLAARLDTIGAPDDCDDCYWHDRWAGDGAGLAGWLEVGDTEEFLGLLPAAHGDPVIRDLRSIAGRAIERGCGLLWGRDLECGDVQWKPGWDG